MSTQTPPIPTHRTHRHTRSAALPTPTAASQNPQNPHYLNLQSHGSNSQLSMVQSPQPTTPPRTPQKPEHGAYTQHGPQAPGSDSAPKPRSKGKNRPKNTTASPAASKNDRSTSPLTGMQSGGMVTTTTTTSTITTTRPISTPSAAAYAGPTFHASPAPSALPIPSFYSKSVPETPVIKGLPTQKETSSGGIDSPTPPSAKVAMAQPQREESPLDFFFKADREEKARARSASSFHGTSSESGPFPPPYDSPLNKHDNPSVGSQSGTRAIHFSRGSASALFALELDGTDSPGKPYGAAFSTPYNDRINAARSSATSLQSPSQKSQGQQQSTDRSEALKAYLFSTQTRSPLKRSKDFSNPLGSPTDQTIPSQASRNVSSNYGAQSGVGSQSRPPQNNFPYINNSATSRHSPRAGSRSSGLRQEVTSTTTPSHVTEQLVGPYPSPPSPSRPPRQEFQSSASRNPGDSPDPVCSTSYNSASQPVMTSRNQSNEFKEMEDSLKRILKLEPTEDANVQTAAFGRIPEAAVSVPNYVGGRAPPMDGMHNGVMES